MHCYGNTILIKIDNVLKCCRNLLILNEHLDAVRILPTSVLEYLEQNGIVDQTKAYSMASNACLSILAEIKEPFDTSISYKYVTSRRRYFLYSI